MNETQSGNNGNEPSYKLTEYPYIHRIYNPPVAQRGQGMMEYVIIVALIAVAAIGIYSAFGKTLRVQTAGMAQEVAGQSASTANATNAANAAAGRANDPQKAGMGRYNFGNDQAAAQGGGQ